MCIYSRFYLDCIGFGAVDQNRAPDKIAVSLDDVWNITIHVILKEDK